MDRLEPFEGIITVYSFIMDVRSIVCGPGRDDVVTSIGRMPDGELRGAC